MEDVGDSEFAYIRPLSTQFAVMFGGSPYEGPDPLLLAIVVRALEAEIVAFVPASLQEAARKAAWIAWAHDDDYCYLDDTEEGNRVLVEALQAIGRATAYPLTNSHINPRARFWMERAFSLLVTPGVTPTGVR